MAVDDDHPSYFPSFFKIILEPRYDLHKLGIPKKFMTDHGSDLSDVVSLKIPTGKKWEVGLLRENGRAWFKDGWPEVVNFCSICHGHFLMFTYGGKSQFTVYIFDMTACEIEYPLDLQETVDLQKRVTESTKIKSTAPISSSNEKGMGALVRQYKRKFGTLTTTMINKINTRRFEKPSFTVRMQPSYVEYRFSLNVPLNFVASRHISNKPGNYTLENPSGARWPVKCIGKAVNCTKFRGWKKFALDNNLRVGDICVFELIKDAKNLFKVEIIQCSSRVAAVTCCPSSSKKSADLNIEAI